MKSLFAPRVMTSLPGVRSTFCQLPAVVARSTIAPRPVCAVARSPSPLRLHSSLSSVCRKGATRLPPSSTSCSTLARFFTSQGTAPAAGPKTRSQRNAERSATVDFPREVSRLFATVDDALVDMKEENPGFSVEYTADELTVHTQAGDFFIRKVDGEELIMLLSPKQGATRYKYDPVIQQWACPIDGHFFIEMFTRDIIHLCRGFPKF